MARARAARRDRIEPRVFWPLLAAGAAMVGWGLRLVHVTRIEPRGFATWLLGGVVLHDLVLVPAVLATGAAMRRVLPPRLLGPLQAGLLLSGTAVVFSVPALLGPGRTPRDPSRLPTDPVRGLALALAAIWLGVGLVAAARRLRRAP